MSKWIFGFWCFLILDVLFVKVKSDCDVEVENALRALLAPQDYPTMQLQSLRRQLVHKLQQGLERLEEEDDPNLKRSLSALARWNNLPEKRNLEALARAGYIKTVPDLDDTNESYKRSIANLAKNGQLPTHDDQKRGIQSLARNGEIHSSLHGHEHDQLDEDLYAKRNVASLARNYNYPSYQKKSVSSLARSGDLARFYYKRNIQSLARDGDLLDKRNVAALLRQDNYWNEHNRDVTEGPNMEKRNIASIKAQYNPKYKRSLRNKRQVNYEDNLEFPSPVYQNTNVYDYEELMKLLNGETPDTEKRFLGRLPQMGKPKSTVSPKIRFH